MLSGAEFVAVTQIIIYTGGILILLIFGIMLTNRIGPGKVVTGASNRFMGISIGILFFALISTGILQCRFAGPNTGIANSFPGNTATQNIGILLMTDYVLPFELAGLLLLVALVGAAFLAGKNFGEKNDTR